MQQPTKQMSKGRMPSFGGMGGKAPSRLHGFGRKKRFR